MPEKRGCGRGRETCWRRDATVDGEPMVERARTGRWRAGGYLDITGGTRWVREKEDGAGLGGGSGRRRCAMDGDEDGRRGRAVVAVGEGDVRDLAIVRGACPVCKRG